MARYLRRDWNLPDKDIAWHHARLAVLMDIRDELQAIHGMLRCYRIQRMFNTIDRIDKRLAKRIPLK